MKAKIIKTEYKRYIKESLSYVTSTRFVLKNGISVTPRNKYFKAWLRTYPKLIDELRTIGYQIQDNKVVDDKFWMCKRLGNFYKIPTLATYLAKIGTADIIKADHLFYRKLRYKIAA